jgi:hypothetical protein
VKTVLPAAVVEAVAAVVEAIVAVETAAIGAPIAETETRRSYRFQKRPAF